MVKFVVIDDEKEMRDKVKKIIRSVTFNSEVEIKILEYAKYSASLQKEIEDVSIRKIYIIDIELQDILSGIQIAKRIREKDWNSEIIFMTNHDKMFETVYRNVYKVFDFIEKFHNFNSRLSNVIQKIMQKDYDPGMFVYHARNIDLNIYYKELLYIYRDTGERKIVLVTNNNKFAINLGIKEILEQLDSRFALVHRACIVNKDHVQKYNWSNKYFTLDNGESVDLLSKKYRKEVE